MKDPYNVSNVGKKHYPYIWMGTKLCAWHVTFLTKTFENELEGQNLNINYFGEVKCKQKNKKQKAYVKNLKIN
jgi:hypothetical protein